jgi:polyferredoxin
LRLSLGRKTTRRLIQFGFLALTLIGVFVVKGNAERWCPFGGVEAIYTYVQEGDLVCSLGVSNFYVLGGVLLLTVLMRRAFCGYACPIGTISEWIQRGASWAGIRAVAVPEQLDRGLSLLKYPVLAIILFITWRAGELLFREFDPCYALISRHGEDITFWAYVAAGAIIVFSLFIVMPFCRWLCPLAAVLNPLSRVGLVRVKRDHEVCMDCGECSISCPMAIPVDRLKVVTAARCISCMNCLEVCPAEEENAIGWGPGRRRWPQAALVAALLVCLGTAVGATYVLPIASFTKTSGTRPDITTSVVFEVRDLDCRGRANMLMSFLYRDDEYALSGYLKVEAWPGPDPAALRITYDPALTSERSIQRAITEPYYNAGEDVWEMSPFEIVGYDPLAIDD